jgi:hypothetical protein
MTDTNQKTTAGGNMMNQEIFTVEEENLICAFTVSGRAELIEEMRSAVPLFEESEMAEIAVNTLKKLDALTDEEFSALTLSPAYFNEEETEV